MNAYEEALEAENRELREIIAELRRLLAEHHAVGVLDDARVGDRCPICWPLSNHVELAVRA